MSDRPGTRPRTRAAQALGWVEPTVRAIVPPIHPSASYERAPDGSYPGGHTYSRDQNPTFDQLEALLASLEGGAEALVFSSGMAAATTIFETLGPGDRVVAPRSMYWTIRGWIEKLPERRNIDVAFVPNDDEMAIADAIGAGRTRLVWVETPSNPLCEITDIQRVANAAHASGAVVVADSTVATPVLTRPLEHGADIVMHSATKQLNGHADVLAGALVTGTKGERWDEVRYERAYRGAVLGPFEAWLLLRGMRTLFLRVEASSRNAMRVCEALDAHSSVEHVYYAGLPEHPRHELASRQMTGGYGPIVSFRVRGGEDRARRVLTRLRVFKDATSLGGVESLVEHRARIEGPSSPLPRNLLRLSIGIEDPDDLVNDLCSALDDG